MKISQGNIEPLQQPIQLILHTTYINHVPGQHIPRVGKVYIPVYIPLFDRWVGTPYITLIFHLMFKHQTASQPSGSGNWAAKSQSEPELETSGIGSYTIFSFLFGPCSPAPALLSSTLSMSPLAGALT